MCAGKCGQGKVGDCYCDSTCQKYTDCCPDFNDACLGPKSCVNRCSFLRSNRNIDTANTTKDIEEEEKDSTLDRDRGRSEASANTSKKRGLLRETRGRSRVRKGKGRGRTFGGHGRTEVVGVFDSTDRENPSVVPPVFEAINVERQQRATGRERESVDVVARYNLLNILDLHSPCFLSPSIFLLFSWPRSFFCFQEQRPKPIK